MSTKEKVLEKVLVEEAVSDSHKIILYNDEVNTFDHVIETLIRVCDHEPLLLNNVPYWCIIQENAM